MKTRAILSLTASVSTIVIFASLAPVAQATDLYWDADGAGAGVGGTGPWNGGSVLWHLDTPDGTLQAYNNNTPSNVIARFEGTPGTVALADVVNSAGMTFGTGVSGYNITGGTKINFVPASGPFVITTNGGTNTLSSQMDFPAAGIQVLKTGPGTYVQNNGGGGTTNRGVYTVAGGTFDSQALIFDSIFSTPAGNRFGSTGGANPAIPQMTLDAGTLQLTQTGGNNNLSDARGVQVTVNGGAIQDGGSEAQIPSYIKNAAGPSTGLYLSNFSGRTRFMGIISGIGNLTWTGGLPTNLAGFEAINTYSGTTTINTGTVRLDFLASNTGTNRLNPATAVTLNSGTLAMVGTTAAGQTSTQTVNGVTVTGPYAGISNTSGGAGLSSTLNLGLLSRTGLGSVSITTPATGAITTTAQNGPTGILGGWATLNGTGWASSASDGITPANITAYTGYLTTSVAGNTAANYLTTSNVDVNSSPVLSGPVTVNTLRFNTAAANTLTLTGTNVIGTGGLLIGTGIGANASSITGGSLTGSAAGELSIYQNNTTSFTLSSQIVDNGTPTLLRKIGTGSLILGNSANSHTGGTQIAAGTLALANPGALGSGDLSFFANGSLQATANLNVPNNVNIGAANATFDNNGNTLTLSGAVTNTGSIGNMANVGNAFKAQGNGTIVLSGTFNLTGSTGNTDFPAIMLGNRNGANFNRGTLNITGTGSISRISTAWDNTANTINFASTGTVTMATDFVSGQSASGVGVLNFTSGTLNLQNLNMANWDGSYGAFTMTDGTINTTNIRNGGNGNGNGHSYSVMTGGVINVSTTTTIGRNGNGTNVLYLNGENAQFHTGTGRLNVAFSGDSTGVVTVDDGLLTVNSNLSLAEGNTASTFGILNLNGGIVRPNTIVSGSANGKSIVNFNGGTLQGNISNANFLGGLTSANIFSGGALIEPNGTSITISQALNPAAGNGVTGIPVTAGGAGYLGAPVVKITGGGGAGATAVATISGGAVTGIQITSAGTGYTAAPTVTLVGGGSTAAATAGTATIAANAADGGLTTSGFGTLTLTGASTYTGTTTVLDATLATNSLSANAAASGIGAGTTVALDGGTFRYTGAANNNGFNRTLAIGANGGTLDNAGGQFVFYSGSFTGSSTLTFIDSTVTSKEWLITGSSPAFSGEIHVGNGALGSGMLQYRSNNPTPFGTGLIQIDGGTVSADVGATTPSTLGNNFILNGGFLGTQIPNMTYTGAVELISSSSIGHPYTNTPGTVTMSGVISGESFATLTIKTATSVTLSNTNTYQGPTEVLSGKLIVAGSLAAESNVTVAAAGTLGGTGTVNGIVATVGANSTIAPGTGGIGTLNTGSTSLTGKLAVELDAATGDKLNITGDLDVTGATAVFTELAPAAAAKYVIAKYSGTLTGTLVSSTLPVGYFLTHDTTAKEIYISNTGGNFSTYMNGFTGLTTGEKLPGADPDYDGISNLLEYALAGFDPTVPNVSPGTLTGNLLSFTKSALAVTNGDLTYSIQESTTLGVAPSPWANATPLVENSATTISYMLPANLPKEFARLKVSQN
ncbi:MAG: autotransporter-associated beta strand repeat-containing protein [Verrucomicrobiota bacterium]